MSDSSGIGSLGGFGNRSTNKSPTEASEADLAQDQAQIEHSRSRTSSESLAESQSTADKLACGDAAALQEGEVCGALAGKGWNVEPSDPRNPTTSGTAIFGQYRFREDFDLTEHLKEGIVDVGISGELTEVQIQQKVVDGPATVELTGTLNTVNVEASAKIDGNYDDKKVEIGAKVGGEAMVLNGKIDGEIRITPKTIGDTISSIYNNNVDPVVDAIAGRDVSGIPAVPDSWDKGVIVSGHVEGGLGAALKIGVGTARDRSNLSLEGKGKAGLGLVGGFGGKIKFTWE